LGALGWAPQEFWAATIYEFEAALDGWREKTGAKPKPGMSRARLKELMEQYPDE
jgi:hypothetical protein